MNAPVRHTEAEFERLFVKGLCDHAGWREAPAKAYDAQHALLPDEFIAYVRETQPEAWRLAEHHYGSGTREHIVRALRRQIRTKGTLATLRDGFRMTPGIDIRVCGFAPDGFATADMVRAYEGNRLSAVRQVAYKVRGGDEIDVVLFLNGVPVITAELKNTGTGTTHKDAQSQYKRDRKPVGNPILSHKEGALVHLAMDQHEVWMTTRLAGAATRFIPFNRGRPSVKTPGEIGAGNPRVIVDGEDDFDIAYLYRSLDGEPAVFSKETLMMIIGRFCAPDEKGTVIWPRYHQLTAVRNLVRHAERHGAGQNYLLQHSAGSGKSNTIAWCAHNLAFLHGADNRPVFDAILIVTDRVALDKQIKRIVERFSTAPGYVRKIDGSSRDLRSALSDGAKIILTTIQKFSTETMEGLRNEVGDRFMILIDEAHSSQSGEHAHAMMDILGHEEDQDGLTGVEKDLRRRQMNRRPPNVSCAAFTATPKPVTLERFGTHTDRGKRPFHSYSMRQAIEEGFIKDVLHNYRSYTGYYDLVKAVEDDPRLRSAEAQKRILAFAHRSEAALTQKAAVICGHFVQHVLPELSGHAKAMVVCEGRANAVMMCEAIRKHAADNGLAGVRPIAAFSDSVLVGGVEETEASVNGFPSSEIEKRMDSTAPGAPNILVVADKFQTGYDQPKMVGMYVDKSLSGISAVQTLCRLNRVCDGKSETFVLDFVNDPEEIRQAFLPYFDGASLSEPTDPDLIYGLADRLKGFGVFYEAEVDRFAREYVRPDDRDKARPALDGIMTDVIRRLETEPEGRQQEFAELVQSFTRFYGFVSQILTLRDTDLEKLYVFTRWLKSRLPTREGGHHDPVVDGMVDVLRYRLQDNGDQDIRILSAGAELDPITRFGANTRADETSRLSEIVALINERCGTGLGVDTIQTVLQDIWAEIIGDEDFAQRIQANPPDVIEADVVREFRRKAVQKQDRDAELTRVLIQDKTIQGMVARMFLSSTETLRQ